MSKETINLLMEALSDILSDKHGVKVVLTATEKEETE